MNFRDWIADLSFENKVIKLYVNTGKDWHFCIFLKNMNIELIPKTTIIDKRIPCCLHGLVVHFNRTALFVIKIDSQNLFNLLDKNLYF